MMKTGGPSSLLGYRDCFHCDARAKHDLLRSQIDHHRTKGWNSRRCWRLHRQAVHATGAGLGLSKRFAYVPLDTISSKTGRAIYLLRYFRHTSTHRAASRHWQPDSLLSALSGRSNCSGHVSVSQARAAIKSAAFSAIITTGAWGWPVFIRGITEASAILSPSSPCTFRSGATTAFLSCPMRQLPPDAMMWMTLHECWRSGLRRLSCRDQARFLAALALQRPPATRRVALVQCRQA